LVSSAGALIVVQNSWPAVDTNTNHFDQPAPLVAPRPARFGAEPTSPDLLLPDLETLPPSDLRIEINSTTGQRLLRLTNTVWNSGQGALELQGVLNRTTRNHDVWQHLYTGDGSTVKRLTGEFVWHPGHQHWHFGQFAVYELWSLSPEGDLDTLVATSGKLSFCTLETEVVGKDLPNFSRWRVYASCERNLQGLSVGWGDSYKAYLPGQAIEITGLADGQYALKSMADPDNLLQELDDTNNGAMIYVEIVNKDVRVIAGPNECLRWC